VIYLKIFAVVVLASGLAACGKQDSVDVPTNAGAPRDTIETVASDESAADTAALQVQGDYMRGIVAEISDDRYEGRGPGTRGDDMARRFLAEEMEALGMQPGAADGSWEQYFDLVGINASQPDSWTFDSADVSMTLKQWDDFIVGSGVQEERAAIDGAEIVFVGYGIQAPEYDWDDYKGADLTGKVLLMMNNDPDWDPELFEGQTRLWYGRWDYKYLSAARQGAVGAIIIHTAPSAGYPFQVIQTSWTGVQFELPAADEPRIQVAGWLTEDASRQLVEMAGLDLDVLREAASNRDFEPVPLGINTSLEMEVEIQLARSANVLGLIRGSDPDLRDEVVVFTAHHDHLGIGTPNDDGDAIYNGAKDNATGVAITLAIARAIQALPTAPRRSVLIALVGAEEQGLLGSEYYATNPTFAPGRIAANINYDNPNVLGRSHDISFVGLGKSSIDDFLIEAAARQGRVIEPDQFPDKGHFYRSDQFNFAKIGVPAMYLKPGTDFVDRPPEWGRQKQDQYYAVHYHQPSDEYDPSWNFDGTVEDALLGYWTGLAIANADDMPTWNPGDEFESARLMALEALQESR
jgi:Zn-dependent M28 family amino/carboxypeptidase